MLGGGPLGGTYLGGLPLLQTAQQIVQRLETSSEAPAQDVSTVDPMTLVAGAIQRVEDAVKEGNRPDHLMRALTILGLIVAIVGILLGQLDADDPPPAPAPQQPAPSPPDPPVQPPPVKPT